MKDKKIGIQIADSRQSMEKDTLIDSLLSIERKRIGGNW